MNIREQAEELLSEYERCSKARPKHNAVNIQLEKDAVGKWASNLVYQLNWGTEQTITEAYHQLDTRLRSLKEKLVFEILKHGI